MSQVLLLFLIYSRICEAGGVKYVDSIFEFSRPGIGHITIYMIVEGFIFIFITLLIEVHVPPSIHLVTNRLVVFFVVETIFLGRDSKFIMSF